MGDARSALDLLHESDALLRHAVARLAGEPTGTGPVVATIADLIAALDATQHAVLEIVDPSASPAPAVLRRADDGDYPTVVRAVRTAVLESTPPGARVLVVSKGDPELVAHEGRYGQHFPADSLGQWAGFAPEGSAHAAALIDEAMARGADFFVLPAIYGWWTGYYREFFEHLGAAGSVVRDDDACRIIDLRAVRPVRGCPAAAARAAGRRQLSRFVDALLPAGAAVLVLEEGPQPPAVGPRSVGLLAAPEHGGDAGVAADLLAAMADGWRYLVVPSDLRHRADGWASFARVLTRHARLVGSQERAAAVFELSSPQGPT